MEDQDQFIESSSDALNKYTDAPEKKIEFTYSYKYSLHFREYVGNLYPSVIQEHVDLMVRAVDAYFETYPKAVLDEMTYSFPSESVPLT